MQSFQAGIEGSARKDIKDKETGKVISSYYSVEVKLPDGSILYTRAKECPIKAEMEGATVELYKKGETPSWGTKKLDRDFTLLRVFKRISNVASSQSFLDQVAAFNNPEKQD